MSRRLSLHITIWSCLSLMILSACRAVPVAQESNPTPEDTAPVATAVTPTADGPDELAAIKEGIQATLDRYTQAYNENDAEIVEQLVAPGSGPFRRIFLAQFERDMRVFDRDFVFEHTVQEVTQRENSFVQALITVESGSVANWLFREVDGEWLFSEPTEELVGEPKMVETDHFIFYTYTWSEDVNATIMGMMEQSRETVEAKLGKLPEEKLRVYIKPASGVPLLGGGVGPGFYHRASSERVPDSISVLTPVSFAFRFYNPDKGWEPVLQDVLAHEYTHFVTDHAFVPLIEMAPWMYEGLAEYIIEENYDGLLQEIVEDDLFIPIVDTTRAYGKQDLEHMNIGLEEETAVDYALAYSLVVYITETYGGLEGFWALVEAYTPRRDFDDALQETFGVRYETFEQDWQDWVRTQYGS